MDDSRPLLDDPVRLKEEREAADREYNAALTRLDAAIQQLPADFPHPPPPPDERHLALLKTLAKIEIPRAGRGLRGRIAAAVRRIVTPLFEQQQAFNSALIDHVTHNLPIDMATTRAIESTLVVLHDQLAELIRFQSLLVIYLQKITPFVDTRDRDVAGLLRGLSAAINSVSDELLKRSEALLARDARREIQLRDLEEQLTELRTRMTDIQAALARLTPVSPSPGGSEAT